MAPHTHLFDKVDRTEEPDFFVRFVDEAQKPAGIQAGNQRMLDRAALGPGEAVLDVGCGPGDDLVAMANLVGPTGRLVGLDASEVMIAEALRRAGQRGLDITFEIGDATALPFADAAFDVCRAARVLEHLADARGALAEMVRVTRPDGRIVVFDFDWDTLVIDHPDREVTRTVVQTYADAIANGRVGRQLPRLLREQHVEVLSVAPLQITVHYALAELFLGGHLVELQARGAVTPGQAKRWWEHLRRADGAGTLLIGFTAFVVVGAHR
jgi:ubiquinone/menaquinone biosynthesis C-methylase UbiE